MKIFLDESMHSLGIQEVVVGYARNVDPKAPFSSNFLRQQKEMEEWALQADLTEVKNHPYIQGYEEVLKKIGRSIKKNPPTIPSFIKNIQHRGSIPSINTIVDIYNVESLRSFIAIGGHDLDKVDGPIEITVSKKEDTFLPISSTEKHVEPTDYVYKDQKGIMAWIGVRDGEAYKFDENTKNAIFILTGNGHISVEDRIKALKRIEANLKECMPSLEFEIEVIQ